MGGEMDGEKQAHTLPSSRSWNEELLQDVCAGLAEELHLAPNAPGGMVEFRRTLTLSFFFKFYLTVLQKLGKANLENVSTMFGGVAGWAGWKVAPPLSTSENRRAGVRATSG